ncbi:MAG: hypothetical protein F6J98_08510 [Moorea sp. SIO4G2]|nr:hypothetical protein [Moorena sp. SIO4G2]
MTLSRLLKTAKLASRLYIGVSLHYLIE